MLLLSEECWGELDVGVFLSGVLMRLVDCKCRCCSWNRYGYEWKSVLGRCRDGFFRYMLSVLYGGDGSEY